MSIFRNLNHKVAAIVAQPAVNGVLILAALVLAAAVFIITGLGKVGPGYAGFDGYAAYVGYVDTFGLPGSLLMPLVILLEIGGGIALVLGFQTRLVALALAIFCIVSAVIFHGSADQVERIMFLKNLALAGGLLAFTVFGGGRLSLDAEQR